MNKAKQIKQANKHDEKLKKKNRKAKLNRNILKISICINKKLKQENIHIAIDTAGIGNGNYIDLLKTIDLSSFSSADGISVYMSYMFEDCSSLTSVKLGPLNPMEQMAWQGIFNNTYSLEFSGIDLSLCSESARTILTDAYTNRYMS